VRLQGTFDATCTSLRGTLKARKYKQPFEATLSACGDGYADLAAGETCDLPPVPDVLALELATPQARTATLGPDGGLIETVGPDGTHFAFTVPEGALAAATAITLTPVAAIPNLPMQGGLVAAADLAPDGLQLYVPATLVVTPASPRDLTGLAGFGYHGAGTGLHRDLVQVSGATLVFHVTHCSGVGAGIAAPVDLAAITALPNTPADAAAANALLALAEAGETAAGPYAAVLVAWYDTSVGPVLAAATDGDAALVAALHEWVRFRWVTGADVLFALGLPFDVDALHGANGFALANRLDAGGALVAAGLRAAIARANAACLAAEQVEQAEAALRWQGIAAALGLATAAAQLDLATVLDALCVEVLYEELTFPQVPQAGVPALLAFRAALALRTGPVVMRSFLVAVTASGATPPDQGTDIATDAEGRYEKSFTPTGSQPVTLRIHTCAFAPGLETLVRVCQDAVVVRGELVVEPADVRLPPGGTQQFSAALFGLPTSAVSWEATGGTIDTAGVYTAGDVPGSYTVTATSTADPGLSAQATVVIAGSGRVVPVERTSVAAFFDESLFVEDGFTPTLLDLPLETREFDDGGTASAAARAESVILLDTQGDVRELRASGSAGFDSAGATPDAAFFANNQRPSSSFYLGFDVVGGSVPMDLVATLTVGASGPCPAQSPVVTECQAVVQVTLSGPVSCTLFQHSAPNSFPRGEDGTFARACSRLLSPGRYALQAQAIPEGTRDPGEFSMSSAYDVTVVFAATPLATP
jgi:hypothetical protein